MIIAPFSYHCACCLFLGQGEVGAEAGNHFLKTTTKKPGVSKLPIMPNEFGVCMVYGRCCTWYDGARHTGVSRHFCPVGIFWSPEFLCVCFLLPSRIGEKEHGIPTAAMECLFLYCLGLAGKSLISEAWSHDLLPSTI